MMSPVCSIWPSRPSLTPVLGCSPEYPSKLVNKLVESAMRPSSPSITTGIFHQKVIQYPRARVISTGHLPIMIGMHPILAVNGK
ncbi:hypothetical protein ACHAXH_000083, partial [Discostella pseudostelligera]